MDLIANPLVNAVFDENQNTDLNQVAKAGISYRNLFDLSI